MFCQVEAQNRKIAFEKSTLQEALNKASSRREIGIRGLLHGILRALQDDGCFGVHVG